MNKRFLHVILNKNVIFYKDAQFVPMLHRTHSCATNAVCCGVRIKIPLR